MKRLFIVALALFMLTALSAGKNNGVVLSDNADKNKTMSPCRVRVMQYNVGRFNKGYGQERQMIPTGEYEDYIKAYKRFFGEQQPDIICLEEWEKYIDVGNVYPAKETLLDPIYPYATEISSRNMIASRYEISYDHHWYITPEEETGAILHKMVCDINGRSVFVVSGHLRVLATQTARIQAFEILVAEAAKYDYAIICVDTNAVDEEEARVIIDLAKQVGLSSANGGYFGEFPTLASGSAYQNIDNIFVKGGIIVNVTVPQVLEALASDHLPIIADILLY